MYYVGVMEQLLASFWQTLQQTLRGQIVGGGLVLMVAGAALALARNLPRRLWGLFLRQFTVTIDVRSQDPLFHWLEEWLDAHPYSKKSRRLSASSDSNRRATSMPVANQPTRHEEDGQRKILLAPAPGEHLIWIGGRPVWLSRERKDPSEKNGRWWVSETIRLRTFGRDRASLVGVLRDARDLAQPHERSVGVYVCRYGNWHRVHDAQPRPLDSVILPDGVMDDLVEDAEHFLSSETWYRDRGIPWRRGYMLEGTPGSGKTSTIVSLTGHIRTDLYIVNISSKGMDDQQLMATLLAVPPRSCVLFEDVDGVVTGRDMKGKGDDRVTFAGLLNALDGAGSQPGVMTFLTTNRVESLDPALLRPGRVDYRLTFSTATRGQAARFFERFYGLSNSYADDFAAHAEGMTMAEIQGVCLKSRSSAANALASVRRRSAAAS